MNNLTSLIDMDDTLIPNAFTYFQPQLEMAGLIVWDLGIHSPPPIQIINRATESQIKMIKEHGYISKHNFPMSYVDTYIELCKEKNREVNKKISSAIAMAGIKYFREEYKLYDGVIETLTKIRTNNWKKIILTRGDIGVQQYKIDNTNIGKFFDHIEIVASKNKQTYLDTIEKYNLIPEQTIMIGDSLRNDIMPALEVGMIVGEKYDSWYDSWCKSKR